MREYEQDNPGPSLNLQPLLLLLRAVGAILGIIAIILGLIYATRMFDLISGVLEAPETFQALLDKWTVAVGEEQLDIVIAGTTYRPARFIAIMVLGGGATILAWISMGLILAGAKTVSWTLTDREAIKTMLVHAFGPARRIEPGRPNERK